MSSIRSIVFLSLIVGLILPVTWRDADALPLLEVTVQPIQVCDDAGLNCANPALELFEAVTNKIWAQASMNIDFLSWLVVDDSNRLVEDAFADLGANSDPGIVNMWFVEDLTECGGAIPPGFILFGCGGGGRVAITDWVFSFNGGIGRLDTIAHELGHVFGLGHGNFGAGGADNLMTSGGSRSVPSTIGDVNPDGAQLSKLTNEQITQARSSDFAIEVPEPTTLALLGMGLIMLAARRRSLI